MAEVESAPTTSKKQTIMLWPSVAMLVMVFGFWVFLYDDRFDLLFWLAIHFFAAICCICLIVLRRQRKSLSFLIPILLASTMGWWFIPVSPMIPIGKAFAHSRDYIEFLIFDARHHIKAEARQNRYRYKKWHLCKRSSTYYQIVYDTTGKTLREGNTEHGGCYDEIFGLGGHFYFVRGICPGVV